MSESASNIVGLRGCVPEVLQGEVNPELVEMLEQLLSQAKAGQLMAFGFVAVINDGTAAPVRESNWYGGGVGSSHHFYVALRELIRRFERHMDGE